jgi:hypothetical protein
MATFVLAHRSPTGYVGTAETGAAWSAWLAELGSQLLDQGNPVFTRQPLGNCGPETGLGGYTLVTTDDLEGAVALARGCPMLAVGGGVEVGELTVLNAGREPIDTAAA